MQGYTQRLDQELREDKIQIRKKGVIIQIPEFQQSSGISRNELESLKEKVIQSEIMAKDKIAEVLATLSQLR
jgi:hypothetical protein